MGAPLSFSMFVLYAAPYAFTVGFSYVLFAALLHERFRRAPEDVLALAVPGIAYVLFEVFEDRQGLRFYLASFIVGVAVAGALVMKVVLRRRRVLVGLGLAVVGVVAAFLAWRLVPGTKGILDGDEPLLW